MTEYVERDLAEKALLDRCEETGYGGLNRNDVTLVMRTPWRIPTADVAPVKHGRDIRDMHDGHCEFKCSVCGAWAGEIAYGTLDGGKFHYCPNCGARMDGKLNDR